MSGRYASSYGLLTSLQKVLEVIPGGGISTAMMNAMNETTAKVNVQLKWPAAGSGGAGDIRITDALNTPAIWWTVPSSTDIAQYPTGDKLRETTCKIQIVTYYQNIVSPPPNEPPSESDMIRYSVLYGETVQRAIMGLDGIQSLSDCSLTNVRMLDMSVEDYFQDGLDNEYGHLITLYLSASVEDKGYG